MIERTNHIVSRCYWNTSFDDKVLVTELQDSISQWTKHRFHLEANDIFEKLCPKDHVWRIDQLHLDLGIIDFDEIQSTLSRRFSKQMKTELINLLLNSDNTDKIKIDTFENAQLDLLEYYLINGYAAWNHDFKYISIQDILSYQLKNNSEKLKLSLYLICKNEKSRQRLAWQTSMNDIYRIVQLLEPYRYKHIIAYIDIVKSFKANIFTSQKNNANFLRSLWNWTFDYLFSNKGNLFNSTEFTKAILKQLSHYFDTDLYTLLKVISTKSSRKIYKNKQFGLVFIRDIEKLIAANNGSINISSNENTFKLDSSRHLKKILLNPVSELSNFNKDDISELIDKLYEQNPEKFRKAINELKIYNESWNVVLKKMDKQALHILCRSLMSDNYKHIIQLTEVLISLPVFSDKTLRSKALLRTIIKYILNKKSESLDYIDILKFSITQLESKTKVSRDKIIYSLIETESLNPMTAIEQANFSKYLNEFIVSEIKSTSKSYTDHIHKLLNTLLSVKQKSYEHKFSDKLIDSHEALLKLICIDPLQAFEILKCYRDKVKLPVEQLTNLLDSFSMLQMIFVAHPKIHSTICNFDKLFENVLANNDALDRTLMYKISHELIIEAFSMILRENSTEKNYQESIINAVLSKYYKFDFKSFFELFYKLFEHSDISLLKLSNSFINSKKKELSNKIERNNNNFKSLIASEKNDKLLVSKILESKSYNKAQPYSQLLDHHDLEVIFEEEYKFIVEYIDKILEKNVWSITEADKDVVRKKLIEAANEILLAYETHFGDKQKISAKLNAIAAYHIDIVRKSKNIIQSRLEEIESQLVKHKSDHLSIGEQENAKVIDDLKLLIQEPKNTFKSKSKRGQFKKALKLSLRYSPKNVVALLRKEKPDKSIVSLLRESIRFERFTVSMSEHLNGNVRSILESLKTIFSLMDTLHTSFRNSSFELEIWTVALKCISDEKGNPESFNKLISKAIQQLVYTKNIESGDIIKVVEDKGLIVTNHLKESLEKQSTNFKMLYVSDDISEPSGEILNIYNNNKIEELCFTVISQNKLPDWYSNSHKTSVKSVLVEVLQSYPLTFLNFLKSSNFITRDLTRFNQLIEFSELVDILVRVVPEKRNSLLQMRSFYDAVKSIKIPNSHSQELEYKFFRHTVKVWTTSKWSQLAPEALLKMIWPLWNNSQCDNSHIVEELQTVKMQLTPDFQLALSSISDDIITKKNPTKFDQKKKKILEAFHTEKPSAITHGIKINNAGLVLINNYIPHLFEYLNLVENDKFISIDDQIDAVHYLQYVATGISQTEEVHLPLNKILCGLHPTEPVLDGVDISKSEETLISEMIETIISHWPSIGSSSVEGFMGNWLIRDGILTEEDDKWKLVVEKKAYDILINSSPFSFSIINHKWMHKPLYVEWPY